MSLRTSVKCGRDPVSSSFASRLQDLRPGRWKGRDTDGKTGHAAEVEEDDKEK